MKWEKTVKDAVLGTLAAIAALIAFMLITLISFFPLTMMNITYELGMDKTSLRFAKRAYKSTNEIACIAFALETAIGLGNEEEIIYCGETLIADKKFASYCEKRNEKLPEDVATPYELYVYGQVCVAMYETDDKTAAIERAFSYTTGFPKNNPVALLVLCALTEKDVQTAQEIKTKMQGIEGTLSQTDKAYFDGIIGLIG